MVRFGAILCLGVPIQCQRLQFYRRPWCQRFYKDFMAPLPCENTSAAWQLFFTARTWAKPHRLDSSVTLLLRRVVQSKTQWHSNVLKLPKSSQALKTFFQLLQIKRLQLKLTNTLHQVPRTWVKQHPKTLQTTKTNENPSPSSSMHKPVPFGSKLVPTWFLFFPLLWPISLYSCPSGCHKPQSFIETKTFRFCNLDTKNFKKWT